MATNKRPAGSYARYEQRTGLFEIFGAVDDGAVERCLYQCVGYAGRGDFKNRPDAQCRVGEGPLPRAVYRVAPPTDHPRLGPLAFPLFPVDRSGMCGRSGFFVHGDSRRNPGNASHGCIILSRDHREALIEFRVRMLEVVSFVVPGRTARRAGT